MSNKAMANLIDVGSFGLIDDLSTSILQFLLSNKLSTEEVDLVLYSSIDEKKTNEMKLIFEDKKMFDYLKITGTYYTNSAFALAYGIDILSHNSHPAFGENIKTVLVCNNLIPENLGLILIKKN
jgi:hypothetical protein